jgi:hypothetical protein
MVAAGSGPFRVTGRGGFSGSHMSISTAETFIQNAKQQISQIDINNSVLRALAELTREVKRLDDDVRRMRREIQIAKRF